MNETLSHRVARVEVQQQQMYAEMNEYKDRFIDATAQLQHEMRKRVELESLVCQLNGLIQAIQRAPRVKSMLLEARKAQRKLETLAPTITALSRLFPNQP